MNNENILLHDEINLLIEKWFLQITESKLNNYIKFVKSYKSVFNEYFYRLKYAKTSGELLPIVKRNKILKIKLFRLIIKEYNNQIPTNFEYYYSDFNTLLENCLASIEIESMPHEISVQSNELLHNLSVYFFKEELSLQLINILDDFFKQLFDSSLDIITLDSELDSDFNELMTHNKHKEDIEKFIQQVNYRLNSETILHKLVIQKALMREKAYALINNIFKEYDTIVNEFLNLKNDLSFYTENTVFQKHNEVENNYRKVIEKWNTNFSEISNRWLLNEQINILKYESLIEYLKVKNECITNNQTVFALSDKYSQSAENIDFIKIIAHLASLSKLLDFERINQKIIKRIETIESENFKQINGIQFSFQEYVFSGALIQYLSEVSLVKYKAMNLIFKSIDNFKNFRNAQEVKIALSSFENLITKSWFQAMCNFVNVIIKADDYQKIIKKETHCQEF